VVFFVSGVFQGSIVEQGTHAELLLQGGEYAKLWELQQEAIAAGNETSAKAAGTGAQQS